VPARRQARAFRPPSLECSSSTPEVLSSPRRVPVRVGGGEYQLGARHGLSVRLAHDLAAHRDREPVRDSPAQMWDYVGRGADVGLRRSRRRCGITSVPAQMWDYVGPGADVGFSRSRRRCGITSVPAQMWGYVGPGADVGLRRSRRRCGVQSVPAQMWDYVGRGAEVSAHPKHRRHGCRGARRTATSGWIDSGVK
jgi:hypothetical protein